MTGEFEFYHGAVLVKIVQSDKKTTINSYPSHSRSSYVVNSNIGLYIKHSSNRLSPWSFSFSKSHQDEIDAMQRELGSVYIAFVCGKDGIACLSYDEFKMVLNDIHDDYEWVRISRRPREKYAISGSDGKLKVKIAHNHFPERIFEGSGSGSFLSKFSFR
jgi:hypothetical protein